VSDPLAFDYAVVRVVPRVEREEFINAGVILFCAARAFLGCRLALDEARLLALAPTVDLPAVQQHLAAFAAVCDGQPAAGPIAQLSPSERFHWLVAPRSTMLQTSPMHAGLCEEPALALDHLFASVVA
jgi:Protein of unknown function (DUF3037)